MKKAITLFLALAMVLTMLAGCAPTEPVKTPDAPVSTDAGTSPETQAPAKTYDTLRVGMMPFGGNVPARYAYDHGYFEELGLKIEFYQFANGAGINEALAAQQVDVGVSGLAMIFSLASGTCKMLSETNSSGGMGIYVRADNPVLQHKGEIAGKPDMYGSADTIRGLKILGQLGTSSQYNVIGWVKQFGLTENDIEMVNIDLGTDLTAFQAGEGDAIAASRPYSFKLEAEGYVCAAYFEDATDTTLFDVIVARNEIVEGRREELVLFLKAYYRALEEIAANDELRFTESMNYFKSQGREYSEDDMRSEMRVNQYVSTAYMQQQGYSFGKAMINIGNFYSEGGKIEASQLPNVAASFDASMLQEALGITFEVAKAN